MQENLYKKPEILNFNPTIIKKTSSGEAAYDLDSLMMEDRIIFINYPIDDMFAGQIVKMLLYLNSMSKTEDIVLYINSPGGSVSAGLSIIDTMNYISNDIKTICVGMAASMGAMILGSGTRGKRYALPNSEILLHQPLGGMSGQASDIEIHAKHILKTKSKLIDMVMEFTKQENREKVTKDMDRDFIMSSVEAKEYGIIDNIIVKQVTKRKK